MRVDYWVAVDGDEKHCADSEDAAHQWAMANLRPESFYTVVRIGPGKVGSTQPELFRTPSLSN
jgi:hypothetical protein